MTLMGVSLTVLGIASLYVIHQEQYDRWGHISSGIITSDGAQGGFLGI